MALGKKNSLKKNEIMFRKASSCLVEMKQKGSGVVVSEFELDFKCTSTRQHGLGEGCSQWTLEYTV